MVNKDFQKYSRRSRLSR